MTADEKNQMSNMQEQLRDVDRSVNEIKNSVSDIHKLLTGDEFGSTDGLVSEYKDIKRRVKALEDIKKKVTWLATGAGLAGGFVLDKIIAFIKAAITTILIVLITSCGIFKKNTKSKSEDRYIQSINNTIQKDVKLSDQTVYVLNSEVKRKEQSTTISTLKGDKITVDPLGYITAEGNAEYEGVIDTDLEEEIRDSLYSISNTEYYDLSKERLKVKEENLHKNNSSESRPDAWGGLVMWIGVGLTLVAAIWAIAKFVFKK